MSSEHDAMYWKDCFGATVLVGIVLIVVSFVVSSVITENHITNYWQNNIVRHEAGKYIINKDNVRVFLWNNPIEGDK